VGTSEVTHSPAAIIQQYLIDAGVATLGGAGGAWPVFVDAEPNLPDNCITVYDTDEIDYGRVQFNGDILSPKGFQVRIRAVSHAVGWDKASTIEDQLKQKGGAYDAYHRPVTIDGENYVLQAVVGIGHVIRLGKAVPQSRLNLFTINGLAHIIRSA